jgi:hypothetical protein
LLKNYKSKAIFFACLESIPVKDEKIEEGMTNVKVPFFIDSATDNSYFSKIVTYDFLEQILKNKYCTSDVLKNLIETKHQHVVENLKKYRRK